jgi:hypothetical protein
MAAGTYGMGLRSWIRSPRGIAADRSSTNERAAPTDGCRFWGNSGAKMTPRAPRCRCLLYLTADKIDWKTALSRLAPRDAGQTFHI